MISFLKGVLEYKTTQTIGLDVNGVGFEVIVPTSTLSSIGQGGDYIVLLISMQVREDSITLYGFTSEDEKLVFEKLTSVSGVGPKAAISALSTFDAQEIMRAISGGDQAKISKIPNIGKKTAQRIIVDLKNAFEGFFVDDLQWDEPAVQADFSSIGEVKDALLSMGFTTQEADLAIKDYTGQDRVEDLLRYALKKLNSLV